MKRRSDDSLICDPFRYSYVYYAQGMHAPSDAELAALPHVRREQITLHKFLGSGAFGEVFEGVARQLHGATEDTKVAVKVKTNYTL